MAALVALPASDVAADPVESGGWTTEATVDADVVRGGRSVTIDVTVSAVTARQGLVDIEINDMNGVRTFQRFWDGESFSANDERSFRAVWPVPADAKPGQYVVRVGVFRVGWGVLYHWNHVASTFEVSAGASAPPPTTTAPPTTVNPPSTTAAPAPTTAAPTTSVVPPTTEPPTGPTVFSEDFSSPAGLDRFNWEIFHGGIVDIFTTDGAILQWIGDHNSACQGPTTERTVHVHADSPPGPVSGMGEQVWWCAPAGPDTGHFMTSMNSPGYSHLDFAPAQSFPHVSKVCWDQNLSNMSGQKWTQVTVIPEATFQANGAVNHYVTPFQQDEIARNGIKLSGEDFMFEMIRGSSVTHVGQQFSDPNFTNTYIINGFDHDDKATRYGHCLTDLENGTVRIEFFGRTGPGSVETRIQRGGFTNGPARVIFQDITYHPAKDPTSRANYMTWHWDNISIS